MKRKVVAIVRDNGPMTLAWQCRLSCGHYQRVVVGSINRRGKKERPAPKFVSCPDCAGEDERAWVPTTKRLPPCPKSEHEGVEVLIHPLRPDGGITAYFGRRISGRVPSFYMHGAILDHITHWRPRPAPPQD